jgi:hypothetical protein
MRKKDELRVSWASMVARCHKPSDKSFARYGARGIRVCVRWRDNFDAFLEDVGPRPSTQHSLERNDNNGDYEPGNVRWATPREQARNRSNNRLLTASGKTQTVAAWAEERGIAKTTVLNRLLRGWSDSRAVNEPARKMLPANTILPRGGFRLCQERGLNPGTISSRIRRGLTFEQATSL